MPRRNGNTFNRFVQPKPCISCGRNARADNGTDCCNECYDLAGEDNQHNDDGTRPNPSQLDPYEAILREIGKKGGNVERVRADTAYLFNPDMTRPVA